MSNSPALNYYYRNRDKQLELRAKYYAENKEKIKKKTAEYFKEYDTKNREQMIKRVAEYTKKNIETHRKSQSEWRQTHREHIRIYSKNRRDKIKELKIQEQNEQYNKELIEYKKDKVKRCKEPQKPKEIKRGRPKVKEIVPEIIPDRILRFNLILDIEDVF